MSVRELWHHLTNPNPSIYESNNFVVLDFEATNRPRGALDPENFLLLTGWCAGSEHSDYERDEGVRFEYGDRLPPAARSAIESADFIVAQGSKYELQWLAREGVDTGRILVWDTLLAEYVRLGNRRGPKDLDSLCRRYGIATKDPLVKLLMKSGICPSEMPKNWLIEYNAGKDGDVLNTLQVFLKQREELREFFPHIYTRCLLVPVLADIERNGAQMDVERVKAEYDKETKAYELASSALAERYPGTNFASPKQIAVLLYDTLAFGELTKFDGTPKRAAGGGRLTDKDTIKALEARVPEQAEFKELINALQEPSAKLTFLERMWECCQKSEGRLYARFNQAVTQNHRLSSTGQDYTLQFQNFPRAYKRLFKARYDDWCMAEADGMGMEFRVGIHLGRDKVGLADIRGKKDVHKATASNLLQKSEDRVNKAERQDAKPETFRPMYYSDGQTPAQKRYAKYFHERYSDLYKTQTDWTYEVLETKKLVTEWGLVFYWPDCSMSRSGYIKYSTNIANYPISCFATGEIIPIGLIYTWHLMRDAGMMGFITNTVHDSIIGEIPEYEQDQWKEIVNTALTDRTYEYLLKVYGVRFTVPLGVESKFGTHWSQSDFGEFTHEVEPEEFFARAELTINKAV